MGYLGTGQGMMAPQIGSPSPAPGAGSIASPPPPIPSSEPPPYDALQDPAWRGFIDPQDHAFRSFVNELSPEHRQMLLQKFMAHKAHAMLNAPPRMPPAPTAGPPMGGPSLPPGI